MLRVTMITWACLQETFSCWWFVEVTDRVAALQKLYDEWYRAFIKWRWQKYLVNGIIIEVVCGGESKGDVSKMFQIPKMYKSSTNKPWTKRPRQFCESNVGGLRGQKVTAEVHNRKMSDTIACTATKDDVKWALTYPHSQPGIRLRGKVLISKRENRTWR